MNQPEARRFVREIADEMQKQGDPIFFTEHEVAMVLISALKNPIKWIKFEDHFPEIGQWITFYYDHGDSAGYESMQWQESNVRFWEANGFVCWIPIPKQ